MLKKSFWFISMIIMGVGFLTLTGCDPEDGDTTDETTVSVTVPVLKTITSTNVTTTSATFGGKITSNGKGTITARGICWDTVTAPKITSNVVSSPINSDTINFSGDLTGLTANKKYYVRAYATNSAGTAYGNEVIFSTQGGTIGTVTDIEGNIYHTIIIGTQVWMVENLKTTKYNDGVDIPLVTDSAAWITLDSPGYCWYNNDSATYKSDYGALYNWYTVHTGKLCPTGWHVPTLTDWTTLSNYLIGDTITGAKIKEIGTTHWNSPNTGATNESGFTALPGGARHFNGTFDLIGEYSYWWTEAQSLHNNVYYQYVSYVGSNFNKGSNSKNLGFSVRCVKD